MKLAYVFLLISIVLLSDQCTGYRILGVFPLNEKSHNIVFEALMKGLAKRGHQVDVITHFPLEKPMKNYREVVNLDGSRSNTVNNITIKTTEKMKIDSVSNIASYYGNDVCDLMGLEQMQRFIKNQRKQKAYHVVVVEAFGANCYMGLGYVLKVPVVAISSCMDAPWINEFTGNDDNLAYVPNGKMSYWQRVKNVFIRRSIVHKFHSLTEKYQTEAMRKYLDPEMTGIREVERNVALTFTNNHPILLGSKPVVPTLVEIAGMHIEENDQTLTPELKKWMDESVHGVVYFSLGSMVLIETLPAEQLREIYASFKKISPMRVLMKVVNESMLLAGLPHNVKTISWITQVPVLAHPNTRVFITHGGLGGLQEALYHKVPLIGIPLFGDQFQNCEVFVTKGMMIQIDLKKLGEITMDSALNKLIRDPTYKEKAVYYSKLFRDQPMSQMDKAVFWIGYVIRNGQALRSPTLDFAWWQLALLDVYGLILFVLIFGCVLIFIGTKLAIRILLKFFHRNIESIDKTSKKRK